MSNYYHTITDYASDNGAMPLLYSIRDSIPFAFPVMLFCIFLILFFGQYFTIKIKTGRAKVLVPLLSSLFFMIPLSLLLALAQLVTFNNVIFYALFLIVTFILFLLSDNT